MWSLQCSHLSNSWHGHLLAGGDTGSESPSEHVGGHMLLVPDVVGISCIHVGVRCEYVGSHMLETHIYMYMYVYSFSFALMAIS